MNGAKGGGRGPRRAGALAVVAAIAVLTAGCGVVHVHIGSAPGAGTTVRGTYQEELAYARCMRAHGLPGFPDPRPSGGSGLSWQVTGSPGSLTAQANDACKHLLTGR